MGRLNRLSKRDAAMLKRQLSHLQTYLGGIKYMTGLSDIVIIVDQQEKYTALQECITLGIPTKNMHPYPVSSTSVGLMIQQASPPFPSPPPPDGDPWDKPGSFMGSLARSGTGESQSTNDGPD
ncbi:hypothetical protein LOK49_LG03G00222 [Camellia lanceoleosa]|uniref:Uncharacterized protein n=1 Tax=Camellia lanceoleosa TaxID=1840588 RepID=A0ACC0I7Q1_9ERIC|nr:hypothetical protein LOK49_LG03G00222 [Camellia lanceoleosa]